MNSGHIVFILVLIRHFLSKSLKFQHSIESEPTSNLFHQCSIAEFPEVYNHVA
jgi:hypothetical protein